MGDGIPTDLTAWAQEMFEMDWETGCMDNEKRLEKLAFQGSLDDWDFYIGHIIGEDVKACASRLQIVIMRSIDKNRLIRSAKAYVAIMTHPAHKR
jgi:signal transduction histidine kinase